MTSGPSATNSAAYLRVSSVSNLVLVLFWGPEGVNGGSLPFYYNNRGSLTDADTFYDQYFRTGTTKRCNYSNPELDKIIDEQQTIADIKKRIILLQQAGKIPWRTRPSYRSTILRPSTARRRTYRGK